MLLVVSLRVADLWEGLIGTKDTASKPNSIPLNHVLVDSDFDSLHLVTRDLVVGVEPIIDTLLDELLQFLGETIEESAASRQHDVLVEVSSVVHGTRLNGYIDYFIKRCAPVLVNEFLNSIRQVIALTGWKNISGPRNRS